MYIENEMFFCDCDGLLKFNYIMNEVRCNSCNAEYSHEEIGSTYRKYQEGIFCNASTTSKNDKLFEELKKAVRDHG